MSAVQYFLYLTCLAGAGKREKIAGSFPELYNLMTTIVSVVLSSPDVALPSVSAYNNEESMLNFVKSQLQDIAKKRGII